MNLVLGGTRFPDTRDNEGFFYIAEAGQSESPNQANESDIKEQSENGKPRLLRMMMMKLKSMMMMWILTRLSSQYLMYIIFWNVP